VYLRCMETGGAGGLCLWVMLGVDLEYSPVRVDDSTLGPPERSRGWEGSDWDSKQGDLKPLRGCAVRDWPCVHTRDQFHTA
jgi:hypothetical protein